MAIQLESDPQAKKLLGDIERLARDRAAALDSFFWIKARREKGNDSLIFERAAELDADDHFRIANIVLQGGGVLGLAHAGFITGMEQAKVRFAGIAGASAGAIVAMGMAAVRGEDLLKKTGPGLNQIIGSMPMETFVDGPFRTRRLIKQVLLKRISRTPSLIGMALSALRQIAFKRGLNPGNEFEDWLNAVLIENGIHSVADLNKRLDLIADQLRGANALPGNKIFTPEDEKRAGRQLLQIMAACTPVGVKFRFPADADYLSSEVLNNSPAALARASMAIPLFFEPKVFSVNKRRWEEFISKKLKGLVDVEKQKEFNELDEVAFLDGGLFSNLPVDAFENQMEDVPTIAVPLVNPVEARPFRRRARLSSLLDDFSATAFMIRNQRDRDALDALDAKKGRFNARRQPGNLSLPTFPFRVAEIDTGDANWLNFVMDETEMAGLFMTGLKRAKRFLSEL